jgi:anti-sigma regulatory factor (Ser/Thr protein kinase)
VADPSQVGEVRRAAEALAAGAGLSETERGTLAVVVTEAATNLVKHAAQGTMLVRVVRAGDQAGVEVVAIDPHAGGDRGPQEISPHAARGDADYEAFHANLRGAGVDGAVRHVRRISQDALSEVDREVALLYVDGAHRYRPARADIERWGARVAPGGTMLVHDAYNAVGVMLAQLRVLFASPTWRYVGRTRSLAEYRREHLSVKERLRNAARQLLDVPWFVRNGLIKVALVARLRPVARLLGLPDGDHWPY